MSEYAKEQSARAKPEFVAEAQRVDDRGNFGVHKEMRDFEDARIRRMAPHDRRGGRIVHDDRARGGGDALQHGPREIARIGGGTGAMRPQIPG